MSGILAVSRLEGIDVVSNRLRWGVLGLARTVGLGPSWTDGEWVEGYTNLLWVLLPAALEWFGGSTDPAGHGSRSVRVRFRRPGALTIEVIAQAGPVLVDAIELGLTRERAETICG